MRGTDPAGWPRWRLRGMLVAVALLAMFLGIAVELRARRERSLRLQRWHYERASQLENLLEGEPPDPKALLRQVHWHDAVAARYAQVANRPWTTFEPDAQASYCDCTQCRQP